MNEKECTTTPKHTNGPQVFYLNKLTCKAHHPQQQIVDESYVAEMTQVSRKINFARIERTKMRGMLCTWLAGLACSDFLFLFLTFCFVICMISFWTE